MSVCVCPFVLITLLRDLGASVFQIALIPIIARASGFLTLPAAMGLARFNHKRSAVALFVAARVFLVVPLVVLVWGGLPGGATATVVLLSFAMMSALSQSSMGPTRAWFKQVLPVEMQAGFTGKRAALSALVMGLLTPLVGWLLTDSNGAGIYAVLFGVALILGYVDLGLLGATESVATMPGGSLRRALGRAKSALRDRHSWHAALVLPAANIGMMIVPGAFVLMLFYDMGMSKIMVGCVAAGGLLAGAAGNVIGGRLADRGRVRRILMAAPLVTIFANAGLLAVSVAGLAGAASAAAIVAACGLLAATKAFAHGAAQAASTKLLYNNVRDGSSVGFGFIHFMRNLAVVGLMLGAAQLGAGLQANAGYLQVRLWAGFHYVQGLMMLSILACAGSLIYLVRRGIYAHVGCAGVPAAEEPVKADSASGSEGDWSTEAVPELASVGVECAGGRD
jgi:hypothetical protein